MGAIIGGIGVYISILYEGILEGGAGNIIAAIFVGIIGAIPGAIVGGIIGILGVLLGMFFNVFKENKERREHSYSLSFTKDHDEEAIDKAIKK